MGNPFVYSSKITVRYQETDQMGVAHHSVFPIWFEAGRTECIRAFGMPYSWMESEGLYLPLIEMSCNFKNFARYEDELLVNTIIADVTKTRIFFAYSVIKAGIEIAVGKTVHIFINRDKKPVNLFKFKPEVFLQFQKMAGLAQG